MSAKRDTRWQALWDAWLNLGESNKEAAALRIREIFTELRQAACVELKRSAARFARLGTSDEDIYNSLASLMDVYRRVVTLGGEIKAGGPTVRVLLAGICEVLNSRLKEFEDVDTAGEARRGKAVTNPVTVEKRGIVNRAAAELGSYIATMDEKLIKKLQTEARQIWINLCVGSQSAEDVVVELCLPEIYARFQEGLRLCLAELDDLHHRKVAGLYTGLVQREWEELGNIIKVQVQALEAASSQTVDPADTGELPTVHRILNVLREAYQHIGPVIDELEQLLSSQTARHSGLSFDEFTAQCAPRVCHCGLDPQSSYASDTFFSLLSEEVTAIFHQPQPIKTVYQMQRQISDNKFLAEEIVRAFEKIKDALPVKPDGGGDTESAILSGITETIDIKIESLAESIKTFDEEGTALVRNFSEKRETATEEELQTAREAAYAQWLASPPAAPKDMAQFFDQLPETLDSLKSFCARAQKKEANFIEKVEKFTFRFKKEVLLYEICTYEEILIHSVSRLRDSENQVISAAAALLDDAYVGLEILLGKNNIETIRPAPHDAFNAFEHDVLVAEKQDGFNKGEIIKMLNTGYRQQDKVILRANVIAAR